MVNRHPVIGRTNARTTPLPPPGAWENQARCREVDPDLFFPDQGGQPSLALAICFGCPVRTQCLALALRTPWLIGIWGGTSGLQRRQMREEAQTP